VPRPFPSSGQATNSATKHCGLEVSAASVEPIPTSEEGRNVERLCFTFEVYPGKEAEYKQRHDEIWPELVEAIQDSGFRNYSLFRRDQQIVAYVECHPDVATAFASLAGYESNARWGTFFEDVIVSLTDEHGKLFTLDEVWHLD
jgi:L-rhamnose mutarotase